MIISDQILYLDRDKSAKISYSGPFTNAIIDEIITCSREISTLKNFSNRAKKNLKAVIIEFSQNIKKYSIEKDTEVGCGSLYVEFDLNKVNLTFSNYINHNDVKGISDRVKFINLIFGNGLIKAYYFKKLLKEKVDYSLNSAKLGLWEIKKRTKGGLLLETIKLSEENENLSLLSLSVIIEDEIQ